MNTKSKLLIVATEEDIDIGTSEEAAPLILDGEYDVGFLRTSTRFKAFGRDNLYLYFQVVTPGEHHGKVLYYACNVTLPLASTSKYVRAWALAAGYIPRRTDRLSTKVFKGKYFRVLVDTVKKDRNRRKLTPLLWYSVIGTMLEKTAGT